jgi:hypothetical protein
LALTLGACTAGGVAAQGYNVLLPADGYEVTYRTACKDYTAITASNGQFTINPYKLDGSIDDSRWVPTGTLMVKVRDPATGHLRYYEFDHQYDALCPHPLTGENLACSKDLLLWSFQYDDFSVNAPGPDTHVRMPATGTLAQLAQRWDFKMTFCPHP